MKQIYTIRRTLSAMLLLMMSTLSWAWDFEVDGIYYNINYDGESVEVTYKDENNGDYFGYIAYIAIPSTVTYDNKTYSVTSIGERAFYDCFNLRSISLPEGVTSIGDYAFWHCRFLTSISIPEGVTSIGSVAFSRCSSLTSISIPESMTSIGYMAFWLCPSLTSIICHAEKVPELEDYVFYETPTSKATLYVPASALADYKAAYQWVSFGTILPLEEIPAGIGNIEANDSNAPYYTLDGIRVDNPTKKGIYIKNGKKVVIK